MRRERRRMRGKKKRDYGKGKAVKEDKCGKRRSGGAEGEGGRKLESRHGEGEEEEKQGERTRRG